MSQKKSPRPPPGRGGGRRGSESKHEKDIKRVTDVTNSENQTRNFINASFTSERDSLYILYQDESRKAKDRLIMILENRLVATRAECAATVAEAEENLFLVLSSTSKLLTDCHRSGMLVVQKLDVERDGTSKGSKPSQQADVHRFVPTNSPAANAVIGGGASPPPKGSVTPPLKGGATPPPTLSPSATPLNRYTNVEDEQTVGRIFHSDYAENKLSLKKSGVDISRRITELNSSLVSLLNACLTRLSYSGGRIEQLEKAIDELTLSFAGKEKILSSLMCRGKAETDRVVERCRELVNSVNDRMQIIERNTAAQLTEIINQSAVTAMDCAKLGRDPFGVFQLESNGLADKFMTTIESAKVLHQGLLRDIRLRLVEFSAIGVRDAEEEQSKLLRSNIPSDCKAILQDDAHFDKASLISLLDHVSFEPRAVDVLTAVIREFAEFVSKHAAEAKSMMHLNQIANTSHARGAPVLSNKSTAVSVSAKSTEAKSDIAVPAAHYCVPRDAGAPIHAVGAGLIPAHLALTPFNKFWVAKTVKDDTEREQRVNRTRHQQTFEGHHDADAPSSYGSPNTSQRKQMIYKYLSTGETIPKPATFTGTRQLCAMASVYSEAHHNLVDELVYGRK